MSVFKSNAYLYIISFSCFQVDPGNSRKSKTISLTKQPFWTELYQVL